MGNALMTVFIVTLVTNIMLVTFGFNLTSVSDDFFDENSVTGKVSGVKGTVIGAVNPQNFTGSSVNTGDPANTEFKLIDALGVARDGLSLLASIFIAPLLMALQLDWPAFMVSLVAVPWTVAFWISLIMFIRGVAP